MDNDLKKFLLTKISKLKLNTNDVPDLFKLAAKKFPAPAENILQIMADCFYEQGEHANCLTTLEYYAQETGEILLEVILARYSQHIAEHKKNYEHNVALLKNYPWCFNKDFPEFACLEKLLLFYDQQLQICVNKDAIISSGENDKIEIPEEELAETFFLVEINSLDNLQDLTKKIKNNRLEDENNGAMAPIYLYFNPIELPLLLMQGKLDCILKKERIVIFLSWQEVEKFLASPFATSVTRIWSGYKENKIDYINELVRKFDNMDKQISDKYTADLQSNKKYYLQHKNDVINNIKRKKPRILFITTRFSTALQYYTRDCMLACERLGCPTRLIIEPENINSLNLRGYAEAIKEFKPDLWFQINYFADREIVPEQIFAVNWFQDPMKHLLDPKTPGTLSKNDYILALSATGATGVGYLPEQIMQAEAPANHLIYKPYQLAKQEQEKYSADIILVSNVNNFATEVAIIEIEMFAELIDSERKILQQILWEYYQLVYAEKINLATRELVEEYLTRALATHLKIILTPESLIKLRERFFVHSKAIAFRSILAEWLIDGGYTNLKLYGNDWGDNPKFAPYAMGVAPNGEILSKIYQSAKIVLGTNPHNTGPARIYETFLSGGFYIANYIAPEYDTMNIRDKYIENEEIPFFYNRQDLYDKLDYFLANPAERQKITERTRTKMLENDTYEALMKRMLDWLAKKV